MDFFRKMFGLPRREEQIPFTPRSELPPEGLFIPENNFPGDGFNEQPVPGMFGQLDQVFREMDREFQEMARDMRDAFGADPSSIHLFFDDLNKHFGGFSMPGMLPPPDGESLPALPAPQDPDSEAESLRKKMLKPSLVPPSADQRKDQDLDSKIQKEGITALLEEDDKNKQIQRPVAPFQFRNFSRSVTIQTVRRPDGTMETRRVERDGDGNETVTITEHAPDGHNPGFSGPPLPGHGFLGPQFPGHGFSGPPFPGHGFSGPGFHGPSPWIFGGGPGYQEPQPHWPPNTHPSDQRGLGIFDKLFGS